MSDSSSDNLELRQLPDSPDARRFVELSSYAADLGEARSAVELALRGTAEGEPLAAAHAHLVGYAAVAYCRPFFASKVRASMIRDDYISAEFDELHALITDYRNRRVAHSHSDLSSTFAFVGVDGAGIRPGIIAVTAAQELPEPSLKRWLRLIDHLMDALAEQQTEIESRIVTQLTPTDLDVVRSWPAMSAPRVRPLTEFTARKSRGQYPTHWTVYDDALD